MSKKQAVLWTEQKKLPTRKKKLLTIGLPVGYKLIVENNKSDALLGSLSHTT